MSSRDGLAVIWVCRRLTANLLSFPFCREKGLNGLLRGRDTGQEGGDAIVIREAVKDI